MNQFGVVRMIAEFVGGGVMPSYRIDVITLTKIFDLGGWITAIAEVTYVLIWLNARTKISGLFNQSIYRTNKF